MKDWQGPTGVTRWVEVDGDGLLANLRHVQSGVGPDTRLIAVVKANAYGLGLLPVGRLLTSQGVDYLAVTSVEEGVLLRDGGITAPILVMGPILPEEAPLVADFDLTQAVSSIDVVRALAREGERRGKIVNVHIKVETGMGRTGVSPDEVVNLAWVVRQSPNLCLEGLFTHFATAAAKDKSFVRVQYGEFCRAIEALKGEGIFIPLKHCCNSAAFLEFPEMALDAVRVGTLLYGQYPSSYVRRPWPLKDPWSMKARLLHIHTSPKGGTVGYGRMFKAKRDTLVGVIPLGYVHGYTLEPRLVPTGLWDWLKVAIKSLLAYWGVSAGAFAVRVNGKKTRVIGKVAMQFAMIDLTGIDAAVGDVVTVEARRTVIDPAIERICLVNGSPMKNKREENQ